MLAAADGGDQPERVVPAFLSAGRPRRGPRAVGERIADGRDARVDRSAELAGSSAPYVEVPATSITLRSTAMTARLSIWRRSGWSALPPQPAVGGGAGHQPIPLPRRLPPGPGRACRCRHRRGSGAGSSTAADSRPRSTRRAAAGVSGLPAHHRQPGLVRYPPSIPPRRARRSSLDPVAFPGGGAALTICWVCQVVTSCR